MDSFYGTWKVNKTWKNQRIHIKIENKCSNDSSGYWVGVEMKRFNTGELGTRLDTLYGHHQS